MSTDEFFFMASRVRVRLSARDNALGLSAVESDMPHGFSPPIHVHHEENETFHIMEGTVRFEVDGDTVSAGPGDVVHAAAGSVHSFVVTSPEGARFLTISDGGFEAMVREMSRPPVHAGRPPLVPPSPAEQQVLAECCLRNGIELLGAPLAL